jgi:hypothetical protein
MIVTGYDLNLERAFLDQQFESIGVILTGILHSYPIYVATVTRTPPPEVFGLY